MATFSPFSRSSDKVLQTSVPTVLIVDDEPVTRLRLATRLKRLGYRVLEAHDGKTGLEVLRRNRPDLTILDWLMPEMDGPTFCEQVRQDPSLLSSQILMMTTQDQPEHLAEGLGRGADVVDSALPRPARFGKVASYRPPQDGHPAVKGWGWGDCADHAF